MQQTIHKGVQTMISDTDFITASPNTTYSMRKILDEEFSVTDFGLKIRDKNIFYFLYLKDKLSYRRGFSIMIGDKTIFNWDNNND